MPDVNLLRMTIRALSDALLVHRAATAVALADEGRHCVERHEKLVNELEAVLNAASENELDAARERLKLICLHPDAYGSGDANALTGQKAQRVA